MTDAHYQFGLTFLHGKAFVATTRMLLFMYKLLLPPGWECLSTIGTGIPEETSIWLQRSYIRQGRPLTRKESEASGNVSRKGSSRKALSCGSPSFLPWLKHRGFLK